MKRVTTKEADIHSSKIFCCPMKALYSKYLTPPDFRLIILARIQVESVNFKRYKQGPEDAYM